MGRSGALCTTRPTRTATPRATCKEIRVRRQAERARPLGPAPKPAPMTTKIFGPAVNFNDEFDKGFVLWLKQIQQGPLGHNRPQGSYQRGVVGETFTGSLKTTSLGYRKNIFRNHDSALSDGTTGLSGVAATATWGRRSVFRNRSAVSHFGIAWGARFLDHRTTIDRLGLLEHRFGCRWTPSSF